MHRVRWLAVAVLALLLNSCGLPPAALGMLAGAAVAAIGAGVEYYAAPSTAPAPTATPAPLSTATPGK